MKKEVLQIVIIISFAQFRIDSYDSLPIEKALTFHEVIMFTESVVNKNKNEYYYHTFLEKGLSNNKSKEKYFQMNVCIL